MSLNDINAHMLEAERRAFKLSSFGNLQQAIRRRRLDVRIWGRRPIVFTAPHAIALQRDGHCVHKEEVYTATLARRFAELGGGGHVTWDDGERDRVAKLVNPDASNRDPNFLCDDELERSPWFYALRHLRDSLGSTGHGNDGSVKRCVHIDVHGMRNPPAYPVDCLVGSGAMRLHLGDALADELCSGIEEHLRPVLQKMEVASSSGLRSTNVDVEPVCDPDATMSLHAGRAADDPDSACIPIAQAVYTSEEDSNTSAASTMDLMHVTPSAEVEVATPSKPRPAPQMMDLHAGGPVTPAPALMGLSEPLRNTLTQMSTRTALFEAHGSACFTHALQLELSLRLRKHLIEHQADREDFLAALVEAVGVAGCAQ